MAYDWVTAQSIYRQPALEPCSAISLRTTLSSPPVAKTRSQLQFLNIKCSSVEDANLHPTPHENKGSYSRRKPLSPRKVRFSPPDVTKLTTSAPLSSRKPKGSPYFFVCKHPATVKCLPLRHLVLSLHSPTLWRAPLRIKTLFIALKVPPYHCDSGTVLFKLAASNGNTQVFRAFLDRRGSISDFIALKVPPYHCDSGTVLFKLAASNGNTQVFRAFLDRRGSISDFIALKVPPYHCDSGTVPLPGPAWQHINFIALKVPPYHCDSGTVLFKLAASNGNTQVFRAFLDRRGSISDFIALKVPPYHCDSGTVLFKLAASNGNTQVFRAFLDRRGSISDFIALKVPPYHCDSGTVLFKLAASNGNTQVFRAFLDRRGSISDFIALKVPPYHCDSGTVLFKLAASNGNTQVFRAFLDRRGSISDFISERAAQLLGTRCLHS
ncbi:hypothetical protein J6590_052526 [Homalodisca vitripennis]|nr:hypothetical protein J6590_052526 [Homalodisca vitripennis]